MATESQKRADNNVIDLDISVTRKKKFRFDKDDSRMVDLNISDMGIISRLTETYPKLNEWQEAVQAINSDNKSDDNSDDAVLKYMETVSNKLNEIDTKMRASIDYIFDAPVSTAAAPSGSMYDVFEGQFRFEHILELLLGYYENNMSNEFAKMKKHTSKYTKK